MAAAAAAKHQHLLAKAAASIWRQAAWPRSSIWRAKYQAAAAEKYAYVA